MLNITNYQRNSNQTYNEILPHTSQNDHRKIYRQSVSKCCRMIGKEYSWSWASPKVWCLGGARVCSRWPVWHRGHLRAVQPQQVLVWLGSEWALGPAGLMGWSSHGVARLNRPCFLKTQGFHWWEKRQQSRRTLAHLLSWKHQNYTNSWTTINKTD